MDEKRMNLLDLNNDCMLEIIKYIVANCDLREKYANDPAKYVDIENFAKTDDNIKELIRIYYKEIYYHRELTELITGSVLTIDFAQLHSTITNNNEGDAYWKLHNAAIMKNSNMMNAFLYFDPASSFPGFPKQFEMIKAALEYREDLCYLKLALNGYPMDELNNFGKLTHLYLDVRISSEALVSACESMPLLYSLEFMCTEMDGKLSDIVPHCNHLEYLTFVPKPNADGSEYAPLAELPNLQEMTIHGAYNNGSLMAMFQAIKDWHRAETLPLIVNFIDELPPLGSVTLARMNSLVYISHILGRRTDTIELKTSYNFFDISKDSSPLEQSLATLTLLSASFEIDWLWRRFTLEGYPKSDFSELMPLLKLFNINGLTIEFYEEEDPITSIPELIQSMIPGGESFLKSIYFNTTQIDQLTTRELARIISITFLKFSFSDWESIEHLCQLTNLQALDISIEKKFEKKSSMALCNLLSTCQVVAFIRCNDWILEFKKSDRLQDPSNEFNTLKIYDPYKLGFLNDLFEALAYRYFNDNDEIDISHLKVDFQYIRKVSEIRTLKYLRIALSDTNGIEKLADLTKLEELTIRHTEKGSLFMLFDQLASRGSPSLQSLSIGLTDLSYKEVIKICRIRSLKKLKFYGRKYSGSWTELVNSNIEDLSIVTNFSVHKLLKAYAKRSSRTKLQNLTIKRRTLDPRELEQLSKLKTLKSLHFYGWDLKNTKFLQKLQHVERLSIHFIGRGTYEPNLPTLKEFNIHHKIALMESECLGKLKRLEKLTLSLHDVDGIHVLADMKNLKELITEKSSCRLSEVYQVFASKGGQKLEHLTAPVRCVQELNEITRIKSLKTLHLCFTRDLEFYTDLDQTIDVGQLPELKALYIEREEGEIECWIAIFKSCKNLERCSIECSFNRPDNFIREMHTILKSTRDPAIQLPLLLTVTFYIDLEFDEFYLVEYIDDVYLKVSYSFITNM